MAVNFYHETKRPDKNGECQIRVSIAITGARWVTSTGFKIHPDKWSAEKKRVKKGSYNLSGATWATINAALNNIERYFGEIESRCLASCESIDVDYLKKEYSDNFRVHTENESKSTIVEPEPEEPVLGFWDYYKMFMDERAVTQQWTHATKQKFNALRNHLTDWRADLTFDDFDEKGLNEFVAFMRTDLDMKNSTIGKQLGFLKWFLRWATLKGYNTKTIYQAYSPKLKTAQKKVVFLNWNELMRVLHYDVPANGTQIELTDNNGKKYIKTVHDATAIAKARDIFCFCCFTSLRYSDANNLRKSNIENGTITITTIKTADTITIELNKYALEILKRYADADTGDYALPHMTNQRMNIYLKDLCELCEIKQPITMTHYRGNERIDETFPKFELIGTHTGRRTFICNALNMGIPAEVIMKWTGHADYKSMKPYMEIVNETKKNAMKLFDDK